MTYEPSLAVAEAVLARSHAGAVCLTVTDVLVDHDGCSNLVLRCRVEDPLQGLPDHVVVKHSRTQQGLLFHEWAALEFLNGIDGTRDLVPDLLGGDRDAELLILEDLGNPEERLLGHIVEGDDADRARAALLEMQRTLGKLHAVTSARAGEFARVREKYPGAPTSRHKVHRIPEALRELIGSFESLGGHVPPPLRREIETALREIERPGPFATFTHGDFTPANAFYDGKRVRLIDWETCGVRHALIDGSYGPLRYIHSVWARAIPRELRRELLAVYREALSRGIPEAGEEARFHRAAGAGALGWLAGLCLFLPEVHEDDRRWGRSTVRQRIVAALDHFALFSEDTGVYPAAADAAMAAAGRLRSLWGEEAVAFPVHRAF